MGYFWPRYLFVTVSIVLFPLASTLATGTTNQKNILFTFFIPPLIKYTPLYFLKSIFTAKMKFVAK